MKRLPIIGALLIAAVLFAALVSPLSAQVRQPFEWVWAKRLTVETTAAIGTDATVGSNLAVGGGANIVGNVTTDGTFSADGTITTQGNLYLIPGTAITVTDGSTITPTTAIQELASAGNVGAALASCGDGQVLVLVNTTNTTITITDTGTIRLAGNAALGQWDSLTVVGSGVTCVEVARANN